ncbi:CHRD domain-containing protein [Roseivirga pacifica]|uniref:CHRD domain-containing protein n=1 Tax=Roseivirga pacifica TaxID=1267423 RepID=UPI003BACE7FD
MLKPTRKLFQSLSKVLTLVFAFTIVVSCDNDDDAPAPPLTGDKVTFSLSAVGSSGVMGSAIFEKREDNTTIVTLDLSGTSSGGSHPSHIHFNTAAEGGDIAVSLTPVDGSTGMSETTISMLDDGTAITYDELIMFDGYINVHNSSNDLATLLAQGDIGENALTGNMTSYDLAAVSNPDIMGTATFYERANNETLVEISLMNDPSDSDRPIHIHENTAVEGGDIAITLSNVMNGWSKTNVASFDNGTAITYTELTNYDGYINVHASANDLATLVAQGDIGQNKLTSMSEEYPLSSVADPDISGTATFTKRMNGETLVTVMLENDPSDSDRPMHIHMNTAAEGGGIAVTLNSVMAGWSKTNVAMLDAGGDITYDELITYDGYINVHASADDLATLVAQGDIGQNKLTGESKAYTLGEKDVTGINGTFTVYERMNGESLGIVALNGTITGGSHPGHIHMNAAIETGGIAFTFNPVDGATGKSVNNIAMLDDGTAITYDELLNYNGYVNIHNSTADLGTLIAQGDIGANELTGTSMSYTLNEVDQPGTSGTITFMQRKDGTTLSKIELMNTMITDSHPGHIHENSAAEGGDILFTFNNVDGSTGIAMTNIRMLDDGTSITYDDILSLDGYVNIHKSANDLATLVAQGDIGSNAN